VPLIDRPLIGGTPGTHTTRFGKAKAARAQRRATQGRR
jgi:hypothetical protein